MLVRNLQTIPFRIYRTVITEKYSMTEGSDQVTLSGLRNRAGLTRRQVSMELGVTEKTIYVWETSDNAPRMTVSQVRRLLEILNCSIEELEAATKR